MIIKVLKVLLERDRRLDCCNFHKQCLQPGASHKLPSGLKRNEQKQAKELDHCRFKLDGHGHDSCRVIEQFYKLLRGKIVL